MEKKIFNKEVTADFDGNRLDKFLQSQIKEISRTKLQELIREGYIKKNNVIINDTSKKILLGDHIEVRFPLPKETHIKPNKIPLKILYEDDDIILINKSPGVVVHPGAGNYENTIVNGLMFYCKNQLSNIGGKLRPGIVHRIDKDTSGLIVVAKNDFSHANLAKQFSEHSIKRTYEALVWGSLKPSKGKINANIGRSVKNRQLMSVRKDKGKVSITNYKTLKIFNNTNLPKISLIECQLETGRTHQIRVHMNFKGNPIIGDKSYGKSQKKFKKIDVNVERKINNFKRQALHAKSLGFIHPKNGKVLFFTAPKPKDFENLVKTLIKASI
jgi:23S rRNA pseudouridine1911/1915/1917 synthase